MNQIIREIDDGIIVNIKKTEDNEFEINLKMFFFATEFTSSVAKNFEEALAIANAIYNIPETAEDEGEQVAQIYDYDFSHSNIEEIKKLRIEGDYYFTTN